MHSLQTVMRVAQESGILALTSTCNAGCCFCSHQSNPSQVSVHTIAPLTLPQVEDLLMIMPEHPVITIGEATTTIAEGEPFTHPYLPQILKLVRHAFPTSLIRITTNGTLLNQDWLQLLEQLYPVELNISLNCISPAWRERIMPLAPPLKRDVISGLSGRGIPFAGSLVALPHVTGWVELEATLTYLAEAEAQLVRIFLPGYTRYSPRQMQVPRWVWSELRQRLSAWRNRFQLPIVIEPALITALQAEVAGVIANSPAASAGIKPGDIIERVDDTKPRSRAEAFQLVTANVSPKLTLRRGGQVYTVQVIKAANQRSGLVMDYDLSSSELNRLAQIGAVSDKVAILTSELAKPRIDAALTLLKCPQVRVIAVRSRFFGGNIINAGLLTVSDYLAALAEQREYPDVVAVSPNSFDGQGLDLLGRHYREIEQFGVRVIV